MSMDNVDYHAVGDTLLEVSGVRNRVVAKGWFWRMFPGLPTTERGYKKRNDGPQKPEQGYKNRNDGTKNRNEVAFAKATLLQNRPVVSSRKHS